MNDEMATRLAQELLDAADEDARARVVVRWLPNFARCQVTTAARVKSQGVKIDALAGKVDALGAKMDAYHAAPPEPPAQEEKPPLDPRLERLKLILAFAQKNWQSVAILLILLQAFGVLDKIVRVGQNRGDSQVKREDLDTLQRLIEEAQFLQEAEILLDRLSVLLKLGHDPELVKDAQSLWWGVYQAKLRRNNELAKRKEALID